MEAIMVRVIILYACTTNTSNYKLLKLKKSTKMICFKADFLQFFTKTRQNMAFGCPAGYSPLNLSISGIFLKYPKILSLKSFGNSCSICGEEKLCYKK